MSAPESAAVPVVEEVSTETPAVVDAVESKVEEPATVAEVVTPAADTEVVTEDPAKDNVPEGETKKDGPPKSSNFLIKLLSNFKQEKKAKAPKSPKKEKKEEVEAPATVEAPKEAPAPEVLAEVVETVTEVEPVVTEAANAPEVVAVVTEEVKETPPVQKDAKAMKVGRRLSSRVGDFFKSKPKTEVATPPKVDEHPPKIDEPVPVAPLENPATDKVEEPKLEAAIPVAAAA